MRHIKEEKSPFLFGKTVQNVEFVNRTREIEHLWLNMRSGINTILISPRRWGKSSLVKHTAAIKNEDNSVRWCFIDMFSVRSETNFYEKLSTELLKATSTKWQNWVENVKIFFKQIVPHINIGPEPTSTFSLSFQWDELERNREEIINLPEMIAQNLGIQLIVCIDEFQNIHTFENCDAFEKLLRSQWQHHQHVSYCLYGSKKTLMAEIFNRKNRAFYRFGDVIMLDKIVTEHWIPFIVEKFSGTGKLISSDLAEKIAVSMKNHPYYVQQLSHYVWEYTHTETTETTYQEALQRMLEVNTALYQYEIDNLSNTQLELLRVIIRGETQLMSQKNIQKYRIGAPSNVSKNIKILENQDFIERHNRKIELLDPALELWLKKEVF